MARILSTGFTLVEILIVVTILGILAMIVIPQYGNAAAEAKEAAVLEDVLSLQRQIDRYKVDHMGLPPQLTADGDIDAANLPARLTGKTDVYGNITATGKFGPYLPEIPSNPFISDKKLASLITVGTGTAPRDNKSGWFFDFVNTRIAPNSSEGALDQFPARGSKTAVSPLQ